jgi:hypothetical protein
MIDDLKRYTYIKRVYSAQTNGLLTEQEKRVLLKRWDGLTFNQIAKDIGCTKQRVSQINERAKKIMESGKRPKRGRPRLMPQEYVVKLNRRQRDALVRNRSLKEFIMTAEADQHPYWTHCLVDLLEQIADQNNTVTVQEDELI